MAPFIEKKNAPYTLNEAEGNHSIFFGLNDKPS